MIKQIIFKSTIFAIVLLISHICTAQTVFEKHFSEDNGYGVKQIQDGYILTGSNEESVLLIKADLNGDLVWEKRFGDLSGIHPEHAGYDLLVMPDGGYLVAGRGMPFNQNSFAYFIRTDSAGNLLWHSKIYSDIDSSNDDYYAFKVAMTANGEIIAAGRYSDYVSNNDYVLIKTDSFGNLIDRKHINSGSNVFLTDFIYTDSIFYFLGYKLNGPTSIFNITKTDTNGNVLSNIDYGSNLGNERAYTFLLDSLGNIYTTGFAEYFPSEYYFLNKYSVNGDTLFTYNYPVSSNWNVIFPTDMIFKDENIFISGYESGNNPDDAFLSAIDTNGTELFRYHFGGNDHDEFYAMSLCNDSDIIAIGQTSSFTGIPEVYLVKADAGLLLTSPEPDNDHSSIELSSGETSILVEIKDVLLRGNNRYELRDLTGRLVYAAQFDSQDFIIDITAFSGLYLLAFHLNEEVIVKKVLINIK
jgi:hypothetical protein